MEFLLPCAGVSTFVLVLGSFFGLGWLVIGPLGVINRTRVNTARFQLLDLLLLVVLLQPSLAVVGWSQSQPYAEVTGTVVLLALLWGVTIPAWYGMTGALSKAGVTNVPKRLAAVLVILPMICAVIPLAVIGNAACVAVVLNRAIQFPLLIGWAAANVAFIAALFGCRMLSRWIAAGVGDKLSPEGRAESAE